jgi:uncharacterized membrane protein YfcA
MSVEISIYFFIVLFLVAFLYASVGHGGASGYLALMALFHFTPDIMKPTALLLNLFVSFTSFIQFLRGKYFKWNIFYPLIITSVPFAFLGGSISVDGYLYKKILGVLLLIPVTRFLFFNDPPSGMRKDSSKALSLFIGAGVGFLSGLIGIGGGILLSPILLFLRWTDQKETAAISALFIFVNSAAGLAGKSVTGLSYSADMLTLILVAFAGGLFGAYFGAIQFPQKGLKFILVLVLSLAAYKLIFTTA